MTWPTVCAEIRDTVAKVVTVAMGPLGGQVFRARIYPVREGAFPAVLVYGYDEDFTVSTETPNQMQVANICLMVVRVQVREATPEAAENALEIAVGTIRTAVMQAPELFLIEDEYLQADGSSGIERITKVKTTRQVKAEAEDIFGEAHIAFEMQWSELYSVPYPDIVEIDVSANVTDHSRFIETRVLL